MLNKLIKQLTCCAASAIGLRAIAHSIAKIYIILHTRTHTHTYTYNINVLQYTRANPQNDMSFEILEGFIFLHLTKGQTATTTTSKPNASPSSIFVGQPAVPARRFRPARLLLGASFFALDRIKSQAKCSPRACRLPACVFYAFPVFVSPSS